MTKPKTTKGIAQKAVAVKVIKTLADLTPDPGNLNKGTERGGHLLETSVSKLGLGRSVVVDKNGVLIGGNKTAEVAGALNMRDVVVVQTTGDKLVVVQRLDLDMSSDDPRARQLAFADNQIGKVNLEFDPSALLAASLEVDLTDYVTPAELERMTAWAESPEPPEAFDEFDEKAGDDVAVNTCPKCGHVWPK